MIMPKKSSLINEFLLEALFSKDFWNDEKPFPTHTASHFKMLTEYCDKDLDAKSLEDLNRIIEFERAVALSELAFVKCYIEGAKFNDEDIKLFESDQPEKELAYNKLSDIPHERELDEEMLSLYLEEKSHINCLKAEMPKIGDNLKEKLLYFQYFVVYGRKFLSKYTEKYGETNVSTNFRSVLERASRLIPRLEEAISITDFYEYK